MNELEIKNLNPATLIPSEYNPREITPEEFENLKNSIREFGMVEPIIINHKNYIVGGHMRAKAALELGLKEVPCVIVKVDGDKEKLLNLALNRISGRWDRSKLEELITSLQNSEFDLKLSGFEDWELGFYNQGPDSEVGGINPEEIQGLTSGESQILVFMFDTEEEAKTVSEFLNDGKYLKKIDGTKLTDLIEEIKK